MKNRIFVTLAGLINFCLFSVAAPAGVPHIIDNKFAAGIEITEDVRYWEDSSNLFTIERVLGNKPDFSSPGRSLMSLGFSSSTKWIRFKIKNKDRIEKKVFVFVENTRIEKLQGFLVAGNQILKRYPLTGWGTPFGKRPFPFYKHIFPVDVPPGSEMIIYIAGYCRYHPVGMPIIIRNEEQTHMNYYVSVLGDGLFYILILFAFLVCIFSFIDSSYRDWTSVWYILYSLNVFLYYFFKFGIQYFISDKMPEQFGYWVEIFLVLFSVSYFYFGMTFMGSVPIKAKTRKYSYFLVATLTILCLLSYLIRYEISGDIVLFLRGMIMIAILLCLFYTIVVGLKRKDRYALLFVLMLSPLALMWVSMVFSSDRNRSLGVMDVVILQKVVIVIEACLMLVSVIYKNWQTKKNLQTKINEHGRQILMSQIHAQNLERDRIAQDLHDDLGGIIATFSSRLSRLKLKVEEGAAPLQEISTLSQIAQKAGDRVRQIAHNLMPPEFENAGLVESLKESVSAVSSPVFLFSVFGKERRFAPDRELNTYRLVSELLQNIRKHSGASEASMQLFFHEEWLSIVMEHNGSPAPEIHASESSATPGVGFISIRTRLSYLRARLLTDGSETGATIILEVPYQTGG